MAGPNVSFICRFHCIEHISNQHIIIIILLLLLYSCLDALVIHLLFLFHSVPPGPPTNLLTSELTNTSVVLEWTAPSFLGGRTDTYYDIYSSNNAKTVLRNTAPVMTTNYQVTGLLPNSFFQITVTAENGVSSLAGNAYLRSAITFLTTSDGG